MLRCNSSHADRTTRLKICGASNQKRPFFFNIRITLRLQGRQPSLVWGVHAEANNNHDWQRMPRTLAWPRRQPLDFFFRPPPPPPPHSPPGLGQITSSTSVLYSFIPMESEPFRARNFCSSDFVCLKESAMSLRTHVICHFLRRCPGLFKTLYHR